MIKLDVASHGYELDEKLSEYIAKKLGGLEKYLPRASRPTAHGKVVVMLDKSGREGNDYVCEATVRLPHATLQAKEGTGNMYAAIDVVEAKLKSQIMRYKQKRAGKSKGLPAMVARFLRVSK